MKHYYPDAPDALSAKKQFLKEHHYYAKHCFKNDWGIGYVIFDTKEEVNLWYKEHTGRYFYDEEYEPGTTFTKNDAIREIENWYGELIDKTLSTRDHTLSVLDIGLPSSTAFGNTLFLNFSKAVEDKDNGKHFYLHYYLICMNVLNIDNVELRSKLIQLLYEYFYENRFKKRIEGSKKQ